MPSFNPFPPLPIVFFSMLSFLPLTTYAAGAIYLYHDCPNITSTDDSSYLSNLRSLLSSFSLYAASNLEFYSLTYPTASLSSTANSKIQISSHNISNPVHGLYSCRGDVMGKDCQDCVASAAEDLAIRCPRERAAVIWYDECMLRYSNQDIFSRMVTDPNGILINTLNISEQNRFDLLVRTTMNELASGVSNVGSGAKKFGTKEANFTALQTLYTLAQCTADLSGSDCNRCLQMAIANLPGCCGGKQGARVLFPSCTLRYEVYPFYEMVAAAPSPTPGLPIPPPRSVTEPKGKSKILTVTIVAIVAPIAVSVVPFLLG